jgi:hypothetical protein
MLKVFELIKLTPRRRVLLEKLKVSHLVKKYIVFYATPVVSLPFSQEPTTGPYCDPNNPVHTFPPSLS